MDGNPDSSLASRQLTAAAISNAPAVLRLLAWPAALVHAGQMLTPGGLLLPATAAGVGVLAAWGALRRRTAAWTDRVMLPLELLLAAPVVALTGGAGSPWLALYPACMLDRWGRDTLRPAVAGSAVSYVLALLANPGTIATASVVSQAAVFLMLAYAGLRFDVAGGPAHGVHPPHAVEPGPRDLVRRMLEDLWEVLESDEAGGADADKREPAAPRALARSLGLVLGASGHRRAELTYRRFGLAEFAEERAMAWAPVAGRHDCDLYLYVASGTPERRFGDRDRLAAILDLMLAAGCLGSGDGRVRLSVTRGGTGDEFVELTLTDAAHRLAGADRHALNAPLRALAHEMGGSLAQPGPNGSWVVSVAVDLQEGGQAPASRQLDGIAVHVAGRSPLAPVLRDYLEAEGARLEPDPARAALTLVAEDARGGDAERECRELRSRHPGARLVCQGVTGGVVGGILLEANGILPMPLTRRDLVRTVREHITEPSPAPREAVAVASGTQRQAPAPASGTVLLAEDDAISARVVTRFLESEGASVYRVADGEAALRALKDGRVRIGLLDMHMPGLSGVEVARELRAWERRDNRSRIPLLALTASATEEDRRACEDAGMDDFLNKPVERDTLRRVLRRHMQAEPG